MLSIMRLKAPGAMQFERMPNAASSRAMVRESPAMASFAAA